MAVPDATGIADKEGASGVDADGLEHCWYNPSFDGSVLVPQGRGESELLF